VIRRASAIAIAALGGLLAACSGDAPGEVNLSFEQDAPEAALGRPQVEPARGIYDEAVVVSMTSDTSGGEVYFTLDGTVPSSENGERYTNPIRLEGGTGQGVSTLRAVTLGRDGTPGPVATHSYVFPQRVVRQGVRPGWPSGFPPTWGVDQLTAADYEMDARVVDADVDGAVAAVSALPTLSLVADPAAFFGVESGIYMHPERDGDDWERPASAELIYPDGRPGFQVDCGVRVQGGSSTTNWKSPKLSLRIAFKAAFGPKKLRFSLFDDGTVDEFDTLVLDAHLNDTFIEPEPSRRESAQYVRDLFVADLQRATGSPAPRGFFVHLYLDGLYWGVYDLHERPDASFAAAHLGGDKSEYDVIRHREDRVADGTSDAYGELLARLRNRLDDTALSELARHLDIDAFIDYMLINLYAGNRDWPRHNWYAARRRPRQPDPCGAEAEPEYGGFRFFSWDAEIVLIDVQDDRRHVNDSGSPGEILQWLRTVPAFDARFLARARTLLGPSGPLYVNAESPSYDPARPEDNRPLSLYMQRIAEIRPSIILEAARWGDRHEKEPYGPAHFDAVTARLRDEYFPLRSEILAGQLFD
jgi:hypothetical protein